MMSAQRSRHPTPHHAKRRQSNTINCAHIQAKAALLSGPPGIGKSTTAALVAHLQVRWGAVGTCAYLL
jgi:DNA polymerase III delta prime subunit